MDFMLNKLPRDPRHVSRLPCIDIPFLLEEFDEHEFLFGIQGVAYVRNLGRFLRRQWYMLVKCVLQLDGYFEGLGVGHDWVWGGLGQGLFQLPEFCGCCQSVDRLTALLVAIIVSLDISPDGDDYVVLASLVPSRHNAESP
jgi:hypothetical protein